MLTSKLACGPMSREVIEAVFRYSNKYGRQLMLICSRNQVDAYAGYVFTTQQYSEYLDRMRRSYPQADVLICRDHCGPGFGSAIDSLGSVKDTIRCDLEHGFDLIHIDLCHSMEWSRTHADKLQRTAELMRFALDINPDVMFEIGTDENVGVTETDIGRIVTDIQACQKVANPEFYVVQTGSLVLESRNSGLFSVNSVRAMHDAMRQCGVKLKEHNADYLTSRQIRARSGIVDAVNIAPQLGVIQTSHVLSQALIYGIDTSVFEYAVLHGNKWMKWTLRREEDRLFTLIAGHYHFSGPAYQRIIEQLSTSINIRECIIGEVTKAIEHYVLALESHDGNN